MLVYVAGKWQERMTIRKLMDQIEELGHTITYDWTCYETEYVPPHTEDAVIVYGSWVNKRELMEQSLDDCLGVSIADCLVVYAMNPHKYTGTCTEMGIAIHKRIPIYIIGHGLDHNIFTYHPLVTVYNTIEEVLDVL